jgi:hypothetical protein
MRYDYISQFVQDQAEGGLGSQTLEATDRRRDAVRIRFVGVESRPYRDASASADGSFEPRAEN